MRTEYRLDYRRARPNRFARKSRGECIAVVLDPDVATVFGDAASVNAFLRSVIAAMPERKEPRTAKSARKRSRAR
jgi:hypothetical protein